MTNEVYFATLRDQNEKEQQSSDSWSLHIFFVHLPLFWLNVWACLEVFFHARLISSQPLSSSFLSLLGTSHTSSVLGHHHLAGGESWSWCQQSSYKACHLFQAAQDAFWATCPVSNPENNFWEHAPRTTVLSDQLQFEHDKWKKGNLLCRSCLVLYIHPVK